MTGVRKAISVLLTLLLVPLIWAQMALHTARNLTADPTLTKDVMRRSGAYGQVGAMLADDVYASMKPPQSLTRAEVGSLIARLLPPDRVQVKAEAAIQGLHDWFWGEAARPNIIIDISDVRAELPGALSDLVKTKMQALPQCSAAQLIELARSFRGGLPPCKPLDGPLLGRIIDIAISRADVVRSVPDRLDVAAEIERRQGPGIWEQTRRSADLARDALNLAPVGWVALLAALALLALLNLDHWYQPFAWVGGVLACAGGTAYLGGAALVTLAMSPMLRLLAESLGVGVRGLSLPVALAGLASVTVSLVGDQASAK